jgi:Subtilase family
MRLHVFAAALLLPAVLVAAPPQPIGRHFIFEPQHVLQAHEVAALEAQGLTIQRPMGGNRYLARVRDGAEEALASDLRVRSLVAYDWTRKIAPSAYAEAAKATVFARLRVMFHPDVDFEDARAAIEAAGGTIDAPLATGYELMASITARVPSAELQTLARDERVFGVYSGKTLRPQITNARAAALSKVTPLFSAPYNLTGQGVTLSVFELATADTQHVQFEGRLTAHFTLTNSTLNQRHATHVAGTMISAGIVDASNSEAPQSKGMAPKATAHEFNATDDYGVVISNKDTKLQPLGVIADNNSWDFALAWQLTQTAGWVWSGGEDYYGGYDAFYSTPYDAVAVKSGAPLFLHAAGNDADIGNPGPSLGDFSPHKHTDQNGSTITSETFCYSQNGSGTDCPATCTAGISARTGEPHCETVKHPIYGPYGTVGVEASLKNSVAVGAVDANGALTGFSGRGPTRDGRLKPELVAKGLDQFSLFPRGYGSLPGTSMSTPVVTGIAALLTEQWRKTFAGQTPSAVVLKTLLIAGADDQLGVSSLDQPGPDYAYGFGLVNAKASVDLIIADAGQGLRIRRGTLRNGETARFPLTLYASQPLLRVNLGWFDPEILPDPDDRGTNTLINDLDLQLVDPSGNTVLAYVLDKNNPAAVATRGVNKVDTTEVVEIRNASAGKYEIVVTAKTATTHPAQDFVVVANGPVTDAAAPCGDPFEPNNSEAVPFRFLGNGQSISARTCTGTDVDFYALHALKAGPLSAVVTASDTPLRVTLSGVGLSPLSVVVDVPAGATRTVASTATVAGTYLLKVEPVGTVGASNAYTVVTTVPEVSPTRRRSARH